MSTIYIGDARRHAGHAHWQNIAKTKSANDQIKGRVIGKLATKIVTAIRRMYFNLRISYKA
jgi:transcriptional/translational regulatory protein YebC/TACO1